MNLADINQPYWKALTSRKAYSLLIDALALEASVTGQVDWIEAKPLVDAIDEYLYKKRGRK
jgi:hypothetical protein